ncbi:IpaC/SipC family type III secretion system effector [Burkholderia ambifaria]|uniref:IpaC/SipC family type III secretion system effector n=1 Tax=Burkholderia ambifaria TaxID=152480 RepID=UPI0015894EA6|nr:IpaC/SipC family type III secretion system effector [Burkholderia ambifaria]
MTTVNHYSISAGFIDYSKLQGGESKARVSEPSINIKDVGAVIQKAGAVAVASASMRGVPQLTEPAASSVRKAESVAYLTMKDAYDGSKLAVRDELAQTQQILREEGLDSVAGELGEIVNTALSQATVVSQSQQNKDIHLERQQDNLVFSIKDLEHRSGKSFQKILELLLSLFQSANQLRQFNIKLNDELVQSAASSQRREGGSILAGAISGAAFTGAVTAVGTAMQVKSADIKGNALANNKAKMDGLTLELQGAQGSLARKAQVKMGADHIDAVTQLPKKAPGVSNDVVAPANLPASPRNSGIGVTDGVGSDAMKLRPSDKQLSAKNQTVLDSVTSDLPADYAEESRQFQQNNLKADRMQAKGHAISNSAQSVGSIARGSADYEATLERADQQILQANSRVASTAADDANENSRELRSLQQEMLRNMKEAQQNAMDAMGSSAGRI